MNDFRAVFLPVAVPLYNTYVIYIDVTVRISFCWLHLRNLIAVFSLVVKTSLKVPQFLELDLQCDPLRFSKQSVPGSNFFCRLILRYEDEINLKVLNPNKIKTPKQEFHQNSNGTELVDGRILIVGLGEQEKNTFYFAYFVVSRKAITDPFLVCPYLVPQMGGSSNGWVLFFTLLPRF